MIMTYFNLQHDDNMSLAKEDRIFIEQISRKLNIQKSFILIRRKHLENQLYFDQKFNKIFKNNPIGLIILVIGGRAFFRLNHDQIKKLSQIKYVCVFTSDISANNRIFQNDVNQKVLHAIIEHQVTQLELTIQKYLYDYQYHLNDQYDLTDQQYYFPDIEQE